MDISVTGLSKRFGDTRVFERVSLAFGDGGNYCLMGPSGGGKTTFLFILMGLLAPDAGTLSGLEGRRFAPVFQEDRLCEHLSAGANIRMTARTRPEPGAVEAALAALALDGALHRPARSLSGGMKRRVALARAMLSGGDTLLFDEPFGGLDGETKRRAMDYVLRERADRTLIWVTHDRDEAEYMGSAVVPFPPETP